MTEARSDQIIKEVQNIVNEMAKYSEEAQSDQFLSFYDNSPTFLHVSGDGKMRNYEEFKKICSEYYISIDQQKLSTIAEKFNVVDTNLVIVGWTGNIIAHFKNGDTMIMNDYSVTNVFKRKDGSWRIAHSHESSLPPEIIKSKK
jgi:ketosteroid isomerase-like protein